MLSLTLFALIVGSANGFWDSSSSNCEGCLEAADDFNSCLLQSRSCVPAQADLPTMEIVARTCNMPGDCPDYAAKVDSCLRNCLPRCVDPELRDYFGCAANKVTQGPCRIENCVTRIALKREWIDGDSDDSFFEDLGDDLRNVAQLGDCDGTDDYAKEICQISNECCEPCTEKMGILMNCVVNDLVRPYQYQITNTAGSYQFDSDDKCSNLDIDDGKGACPFLLGGRILEETNKTMMEGEMAEEPMPPTDPKVNELADKCMNQLKYNVGMGNVTQAGEEFMSCAAVEGARILDVEDEEEEEPADSAARKVISAAFLVVAATSMFV